MSLFWWAFDHFAAGLTKPASNPATNVYKGPNVGSVALGRRTMFQSHNHRGGLQVFSVHINSVDKFAINYIINIHPTFDLATTRSRFVVNVGP